MGKKDAMQWVMDNINNKAQKRKEIREGSKADATHIEEVLKLLNNLDRITAEAQTEMDFWVAMESECNMLHQRLKSFDPYVKAVVEWNDTKNWKELRPLGVRITWSNYHQRLHPSTEKEEYVDISRVLLDDYE